MASFFYGLGAQHWANGDVNWASNTIKVALCSTGYSPNASTDEFYSVAVSGGNIVSAGVTLGTKTNVLGLISGANSTWTSVTGSQVTQLVVYVGGTPGSGDFLLLNLNTGANLPVTPNGGNIVASYDAVNGIGTLFEGLSEKEKSMLGTLWSKLWPKRDEGSGLWIPTTQFIHAPMPAAPAIVFGV
jgi:hypothetical protein